MAGNINFVPMSSYDLEGQEIARRRKMAEMLQAQSMAPIEQQSVGGMVAPISITHGLAKLLQGYSARKGQEAADADTRALGERYQGARTADMTLLAKALEGRPATPETMSEDAAGNAMPIPAQAAMPGGRLDPSVLGRLQTPEISNAAMQMWAQQLKKASPLDMIGKIDLSKTTPESQARFLQTGNPADLVYLQKHESFERAGPNGAPERVFYNPFDPPPGPQPVATRKDVLPGGQVIDSYTTKPGAQINNPNNLMGIDNNGNVFVNQPLFNAKKDLAKSGATSVSTTVVNEGTKAFDREMGKSDADQLTAWRAAAQTAQSTLGTVANLREAIKRGVYSGGTAGLQTTAASFVNGVTGATPKGLPGSELFNAESSKLVLDLIKSLGANPSNTDLAFAKEIVPRLSSSEEARTQLVEYLEKKAQRSISLFEKADKYARANRGLGGFKFDEGDASMAGTLSPTAQEYLRKAREGR